MQASSTDDRPDWYGAWLEPYGVYHTRYLALGCQRQHGTAFFRACCSPLWAGETLARRPAECSPAQEAASAAPTASLTSTTAAASLPSSVAVTGAVSSTLALGTLTSPSSSILSSSSTTTPLGSSASTLISSFSSPPSSSSTTIASPTPTDPASASADPTSRLLTILLPSILVPLAIIALLVCCCCRPRRARRRAPSFTGWGDDAASTFTGQTYEPRFAGLPVLSYLRRASYHSAAIPISRPPSYVPYRRASTLVAQHPPSTTRTYGALGRGLAVERDETVRRESRGLLAPTTGPHEPQDDDGSDDDGDVTAGTMRSRTVSSADRRSLAYDADPRFVLYADSVDDRSSSANATFTSAATSPNRLDPAEIDLDAEAEPTTSAVVRFARISQRGARRLDPRVVQASDFGDFAVRAGLAYSQEDVGDALQPPPRIRLDDVDDRRGSMATTGSRSTAFYSAPSTPVLSSALPFDSTTPPDGRPGEVTADPGLVQAQDLSVGPEETVHLVPRKPAPAQSPPPSPRIRLTAAFRPSSDSSSYAPSWRAGGLLHQTQGRSSAELASAGGPGILRDAAGPLEQSSANAQQRVRIVEAPDVGRRRSNRVSVQHFPRSPYIAGVDDYDLGPDAAAPALGEYDLGEDRRRD